MTIHFSRENNVFFAAGQLDYYNLAYFYHHSTGLLGSCSDEWIIDCTHLQANSAGLALLLQWRQFAFAKKHSLTFKDIPHNLLTLAQLAEIDQLIAN